MPPQTPPLHLPPTNPATFRLPGCTSRSLLPASWLRSLGTAFCCCLWRRHAGFARPKSPPCFAAPALPCSLGPMPASPAPRGCTACSAACRAAPRCFACCASRVSRARRDIQARRPACSGAAGLETHGQGDPCAYHCHAAAHVYGLLKRTAFSPIKLNCHLHRRALQPPSTAARTPPSTAAAGTASASHAS